MDWIECDLCGADDTQLVFRATDTNYHLPGVFGIVRCLQCGLVYLNPRPGVDEIHRYYPDDEYYCFKPPAGPSGLSQNDPLVRVLQELNIEAGSLCDVGCGVGSFLLAAQRSGWRVAGVEPNERARTICRESLGDGDVFPSLEQARFPPGSFDVVTLWHVLEHLHSPGEALQYIHRSLRKGGLLALAVPNFSALERRIWGPNWIAISAPTHLFHFTRPTLLRYLDTYGFEIVTEYRAPGANSLAANLLRTLRRFLLDPFGQPRSRRDRTSANEPTVPAQRASGSYYPIADQTKARMLRYTTRLVYPLAWPVAQVGLGSELRIYALKT